MRAPWSPGPGPAGAFLPGSVGHPAFSSSILPGPALPSGASLDIPRVLFALMFLVAWPGPCPLNQGRPPWSPQAPPVTKLKKHGVSGYQHGSP